MTVTGKSAVLLVAAGAVVGAATGAALTSAAAPAPEVTSTVPAGAPLLEDASGAPVSGVLRATDEAVLRWVDGGMWISAPSGELLHTVGGGMIAYTDADCTDRVLVNSDVWQKPTQPLFNAPAGMNALDRDWARDGSISAAYVALGQPQTGELWGRKQGGPCEPFVDQSGARATSHYYAAQEIPVPADLPGPLTLA
jgi:hypothetical protein